MKLTGSVTEQQTVGAMSSSLDSVAKESGTEVTNISCSNKVSTFFFLLKNVKMPTIVGILTFMSKKNYFIGVSGSEKG